MRSLTLSLSFFRNVSRNILDIPASLLTKAYTETLRIVFPKFAALLRINFLSDKVPENGVLTSRDLFAVYP